MARCWLLAARWPIVIAVLWVTAASAANVEVYPTGLKLSDRRHRDVITITNNAGAPVTFQVERFLWTQDDGGDRLTPTDDLLAVPLVFTVAPAASQVVRVGFRQMPEAEREVSYRVIFAEVPDTANSATGMAVAVVLRMSLPVFFTPPGAAAVPRWSARRAQPETLELMLANAGSAHIRVTDLAVFSAARPDQRLAATSASRYVLVDANTRWTLALEQPLTDSDVIVQATTTRGELRETVEVSPK